MHAAHPNPKFGDEQQASLKPGTFSLAMAALPHEHPKLGAVATLSMSGDDFAGLLERSIERSRSAPSFRPIGYASAPAPAQGNDEHS
jgi:hypothetical protein